MKITIDKTHKTVTCVIDSVKYEKMLVAIEEAKHLDGATAAHKFVHFVTHEALKAYPNDTHMCLDAYDAGRVTVEFTS